MLYVQKHHSLSVQLLGDMLHVRRKTELLTLPLPCLRKLRRLCTAVELAEILQNKLSSTLLIALKLEAS